MFFVQIFPNNMSIVETYLLLLTSVTRYSLSLTRCYMQVARNFYFCDQQLNIHIELTNSDYTFVSF
jgi:hypothetical protein